MLPRGAARPGEERAELLALRWEDVDLVTGRLVVRRNLVRGKFTTPKKGGTREVPINDTVLAALEARGHSAKSVLSKADGGVFNKNETE